MSAVRAEVRATANFVSNLRTIERFFIEQDAPQAWNALPDTLRDTVFVHLERFPRIGRTFLERPAGSAEAFDRVARLGERFPGAEVREYVAGEFLLLYLAQERSAQARGASIVVQLLSIRHQRQLSFDLQRFWP
jgi:plasmid stabilization system protein ParE